MNETTTIAVDLAKNVFEVLCADADRRILERRRLTRGRFLEFLARHEPHDEKTSSDQRKAESGREKMK